MKSVVLGTESVECVGWVHFSKYISVCSSHVISLCWQFDLHHIHCFLTYKVDGAIKTNHLIPSSAQRAIFLYNCSAKQVWRCLLLFLVRKEKGFLCSDLLWLSESIFWWAVMIHECFFPHFCCMHVVVLTLSSEWSAWAFLFAFFIQEFQAQHDVFHSHGPEISGRHCACCFH